MNIAIIALALAAIGGFVWFPRRHPDTAAPETGEAPEPPANWLDPASWARRLAGGPATIEQSKAPAQQGAGAAWYPPPEAWPYLDMIRQASEKYGLPDKLLARLLYQESRFRPDIISGQVTSSAGAVGIAQIVPRWHPDVDPRNPKAAIFYAAKYLAQLHRRFDSWPLALAAYNWGPGNLSEHGFDNAPAETRNYVAEITADVPV